MAQALACSRKHGRVTEICKLEAGSGVPRNEQVFGLEIAMHPARLVKACKSGQELQSYSFDIRGPEHNVCIVNDRLQVRYAAFKPEPDLLPWPRHRIHQRHRPWCGREFCKCC
jgi:hypothetical protein